MHAALASARFYAILDTAYTPPERWRATCAALLAGGADLLQMRAKKESPDTRRRLLEDILPLFEVVQVPLLINDHLDLALAYPNLGLHVGQDDLSAQAAREKLGPHRLLGLSTHSRDQARQAIAQAHLLDYFAVGPIYKNQTKPDYTPVGPTLITEVAALLPPLPFFAIGGINRSTIHEVRKAGARRVVVVSDALCDPNPAGVVQQIRSSLADS